MKHLKLAMMAMFTLVLTSNVNAQDENNPWVIGVGINTVDVRDNGGDDFSIALEDYVGTQEWGGNTLPSISRITVDRYLNKGFTLQLAGSINKLKSIHTKNDANALFYSIDALVKYDLNYIFGETGWFDPYFSLGGGYQNIDHDSTISRGYGVSYNYNGRSDGMLIANIGFNTWFNDNLGLNFQTGYAHHFVPSGYDTFRHSVSLVIKFGGTDTDGDGIYDKFDDCPETPGLEEFNGCPDTDGDGIKDSEDNCPNVAGLAELNGCPDGDKDGIADKDDMCPNVKGTKANKGCPDTDGDSVLDKDDKCPTVAGPVANNGCPWPDTDGDGVLDKDDACPTVAGLSSEKGCPQPKAVTINVDPILFNTDSRSFKSGVTEKLDAIYNVIIENSDVNFTINGHADSRASNAYNLRLSEKRANAVKAYFVKKGVDASRLETKGYGETMPVDSNSTRAGRKNNRRVEVKVKN